MFSDKIFEILEGPWSTSCSLCENEDISSYMGVITVLDFLFQLWIGW